MTVLSHLVEAIRGADSYNRHDLAEPRILLWTDGERHWSRVMPLLQDAMPELLILDPLTAEGRRGPATLVRYLLARGDWKETPVVYLAGIARHAFRGAAGFPDFAKHLFALQYQGQFWSQVNGKDWTPFAFLTSMEGGLKLEVARDTETKEALTEQLENVLQTPIADLTDKRLEAPDFHALATSDPIRSLLQWMSSPESVQKEWRAAEWKSFCAIAKHQFGLDPEKDGVLTGAERLAEGRNNHWNEVWKRYKEAPASYGGIRHLLAVVEPKGLFAVHDERLPNVNKQLEATLRPELLALKELPEHQALARLTELCHEHAKRTKWVWADLGEAPLAQAAFHLGVLAGQIGAGVVGPDWASVAASYASGGWLVEVSAWKALARARDAEDTLAVSAALRAVYLPWLERLADRVQSITQSYPNAAPDEASTFKPEAGSVLLFVDGLRFDLGSELRLLLEQQDFDVSLEPRWAALPTVTATAKPAWNPVAESLNGNTVSEGFEPTLSTTGKPLKAPEFRSLRNDIGWIWIDPASVGDTSRSGWTETGSFDRHGHEEGIRLAWRIEEELKVTAARVRELLRSGWKKVIIITDHGWLLMPEGLPKAAIPKHLTISRWGRCAFPDPGAQHGFPEIAWFWGAEHPVVLAPGISAFKAGMEYAHGGLTIQEALTPLLTVTAPTSAPVQDVRIDSVKWAGLRVHVQLGGSFPGTAVDLRTKAADKTSSLLEPKQAKAVDENGRVSLLVPKEDRLGEASFIAVLKGDRLIAKQSVTVGGE